MSYGGLRLPNDITVVALGDHPWIIVEFVLATEGDVMVGTVCNTGGGIETTEETIDFLESAVRRLKERQAREEQTAEADQ